LEGVIVSSHGWGIIEGEEKKLLVNSKFMNDKTMENARLHFFSNYNAI
jgi:hypothetical protein